MLCSTLAITADIALDRINLALACLVAWAGLSLLWSPDPMQGGGRMIGFCMFAMLFAAGRSDMLVGAGRSAIVHPGAIILSLLIVIAFWGLGLDDGGMGNRNFLAELAVMALPFAFALKGYWRWGAAAVALIPICFAGSKTGVFALWLTAVVWLACHRQRMLAGILFLIPVNLAIFGPVGIVNSLHARLEIWIDTLAMWLDSPLLGSGLGGFDFMYAKWGSFHLYLFPGWGYAHPIATYAGAAHNEPLQLLAELGAVGFALGAWLAYEVIRQGSWKGPVAWSVYLGSAAALIGFPLQNPATLAIFALALGAVAGRRRAAIGLPVLAGHFVAGCFFLAGFLLMARTMQAQWAFQGVLTNFKDNPAAAVAANVRAYEIAPWDFRIRYQLYPMLVKARRQKNVVVKQSALDKAWAISSSASPYSRYLKAVRRSLDD